MTTQKLFKRRVRARMSKTGESYAAAHRHVARTRDRLAAGTTDLSAATELASEARMVEITGQSWETWLTLLDRWGARSRKRGEIVAFLMADHGVASWWAQTIAGGYERTRGLRLKHQQADGFTIYVSKTFPVPMERLFEAFTDDSIRARWLTDGSMTLRNAQPGKVARFDWSDGVTRVMVNFEAKGPAKATAFVTHERLLDPGSADAAKAAWKDRLTALKAHLETDR